MELLLNFLDIIVHLDKYIKFILESYGLWTYLILFVVIFCETGLVITPFLPGDSLIFVVGTFAASGWLDIKWLYLDLCAAAVLGNVVNYAIGNYLGPTAIEKYPKVFKPIYLDKTRAYFAKYGAVTVVVARFLPIVRTFAPFMAGVGQMTYGKFTIYNFVGCVAWVTSFLFGGYFFGNIPVVKDNLTLVVFAIVIISFVPTMISLLKSKKKHR